MVGFKVKIMAKNNKMIKFGIALASVAILGTAQVLPATVPFIGAQVVRAEESPLLTNPAGENAKFFAVFYYDSETNESIVPIPVGDEWKNRQPAGNGYIHPGETFTVIAPENYRGYTYSRGDYSAYDIDRPNEVINFNTPSFTLNYDNMLDNEGENIGNYIKFYYIKTKTPDEDPAANDNANTGGGTNEGGSVGNPTDTPSTPTDGANTPSDGTANQGGQPGGDQTDNNGKNPDGGQNGGVSDNTNTPTTPDDTNTSGGDTSGNNDSQPNTGENQPETGNTNSGTTTDNPTTGESEGGNQDNLVNPTDTPDNTGNQVGDRDNPSKPEKGESGTTPSNKPADNTGGQAVDKDNPETTTKPEDKPSTPSTSEATPSEGKKDEGKPAPGKGEKPGSSQKPGNKPESETKPSVPSTKVETKPSTEVKKTEDKTPALKAEVKSVVTETKKEAQAAANTDAGVSGMFSFLAGIPFISALFSFKRKQK